MKLYEKPQLVKVDLTVQERIALCDSTLVQARLESPRYVGNGLDPGCKEISIWTASDS